MCFACDRNQYMYKSLQPICVKNKKSCCYKIMLQIQNDDAVTN
jgi:hypothetical protein